MTQAVPTTVAGTDGHATPPRRWEQLPDGQSTIKQCHTRSYSHPSREDIARLALPKRSWVLDVVNYSTFNYLLVTSTIPLVAVYNSSTCVQPQFGCIAVVLSSLVGCHKVKHIDSKRWACEDTRSASEIARSGY